MPCLIETLAESLPKPQRGLTNPRFDFLRDVKDEDGQTLFSGSEDLRLLRCIVPIPLESVRQIQEAVAVQSWWSDIDTMLAEALVSHSTAARVNHTEFPTEQATGERRLWMTVVLPIPVAILDGADVATTVRDILLKMNEAIALNVRQYQVASRLY